MNRAFVVKPNNETDIKFLTNLFEKLGVSSKLITQEEIEDFGLSVMMKDANQSKRVTRETIMKKLKS